MKVFFDTNIILEILLQRERYAEAKRLLELYCADVMDVYVSQASYYTMAFVLDSYLRKEQKVQGKTERRRKICEIMVEITNLAEVTSINDSQIKEALADENFQDVEDSLQLQNAIAGGCDYLLTFNISDFPVLTEQRVKILEPSEFLEMYK